MSVFFTLKGTLISKLLSSAMSRNFFTDLILNINLSKYLFTPGLTRNPWYSIVFDFLDVLFNEPNNVLNVYKQIITELSNNNYIIHNFNKKHNLLLHAYRICISEEFNLLLINKLNKS